jgi:hypothetical protein
VCSDVDVSVVPAQHGPHGKRNDAGVDVDAHMPLLSTHLGDSNPQNTFWYLSAVPELSFRAWERPERRGGARA